MNLCLLCARQPPSLLNTQRYTKHTAERQGRASERHVQSPPPTPPPVGLYIPVAVHIARLALRRCTALLHLPPNSVIITGFALLSSPPPPTTPRSPHLPQTPLWRLYLSRPHAVTVVVRLSTSAAAAAHILSPSVCRCGYSVYSASQRRGRDAITHRGGGGIGGRRGGEGVRK